MALTNGINAYIQNVERETMSIYPLTIQQAGFDLTSLFSDRDERRRDASDPDGAGSAHVMKMIETMFSYQSKNDLAALKNYLDENEAALVPYVHAIQYVYDVTPQIYLADTAGGAQQVNAQENAESADSTFSFYDRIALDEDLVAKAFQFDTSALKLDFSGLGDFSMDMSGFDLSGMDMAGLNLPAFDLAGLDLSQLDLSGVPPPDIDLAALTQAMQTYLAQMSAALGTALQSAMQSYMGQVMETLSTQLATQIQTLVTSKLMPQIQTQIEKTMEKAMAQLPQQIQDAISID